MSVVSVTVPTGTVDIPLISDTPARPWAAIVLAHSAGSGPDSPFLAGFAGACRTAGIAVHRFAFPYRLAGRRMPGPAAHAIAAWAAVLPAVRAGLPGIPLVAAGASYGGRMASIAAAAGEIDPDALVYLGYPFHPPGQPDRRRGEHLASIRAPQLFVSGTRDPFVQPWEDFIPVVAGCPSARVEPVDGGGHSFERAVGRGAPRPGPREIGAEIAGLVVPWVREVRST